MASVAPAPSPWSLYLLEARLAQRRAPLLVAAFGLVAVPLVHVIMPRMPRQALRFLELGFRLRDMGGILVINDYCAVYFAVFFAGLAGLLQVVVAPREERRLELLLSKPVRAADFLIARALPVLGMAALIGLVMAGENALAIAPYAGAGASVSVAGAFGASLLLTALALVQLALLNMLYVRVADIFQAYMLAFILWFLPILPTATFLYRPDLFEGPTPLGAMVMVNLVWQDAACAWLGPLALVVALAMTVPLVRAAGVLLERSDTR